MADGKRSAVETASDPVPAPSLAAWLAQRDEPEWVRTVRSGAWEAFRTAPSSRADRTDLGAAMQAGCDLPTEAARPALSGLSTEAARRGVLFADLETAARQHGDLLQRHLFSQIGPQAGRPEALNAAAWTGGCLLYVPAGVEVRETLSIVYRPPAGRSVFCPRTLVVVERGASASVVQQCGSGEQEPTLVSAAVEAVLGEGAQLRFADLQLWGPRVDSHVARHGTLAADASLEWVAGDLGSRSGLASTTSVLEGRGSSSRALLVFFATGEQRLDNSLAMVHHGDHTVGDMVARGALKDHARTVFRGTSDIRSGAKFANSQQRDNTLHLSDGVRSEAIPSLYIDEFELAAGHAATVGKVDPEILFYLQSRGLPRPDALRLVVQGFFEPLLVRVPLEPVRDALREQIDRKLDGSGDGGE